MGNLNSIENLLNPTGDEESVAGLFARKEEEIKLKELEHKTQRDAEELALDYVNLSGFPISPEALVLIQEERAKELKAVCFFYDGKNIRIGCLNPSAEVLEEMKRLSEQYFAKTRLYLISSNSVDYALEAYRSLPKIKKYESGVEISPEQLEKFKNDISSYKNLNDKINDVNITDIITLILATAIKVGASDVHIEAGDNGVVIRLRLDGVLQKAAVISSEKWHKIISRLKILARVKINIENKPQDGRYTIYLEKRR